MAIAELQLKTANLKATARVIDQRRQVLVGKLPSETTEEFLVRRLKAYFENRESREVQDQASWVVSLYKGVIGQTNVQAGAHYEQGHLRMSGVTELNALRQIDDGVLRTLDIPLAPGGDNLLIQFTFGVILDERTP